MPTPKPPTRTLITASWKMPMFEGVAGTTAVTLTANRTAAAAPIPTWVSSPSAANRAQQESSCSNQAPELGDGGDRASAGLA